ncbi:hypothetical protein M513_03114 [Trichuris suis]|uniref:Animal hem peroxidase n=1 Tax=Trichuris suis TaxID=68888 RepID=A0A085MFJ4_9BILA|nr:hypothetical protein M513_03114 [Trichuris suis]
MNMRALYRLTTFLLLYWTSHAQSAERRIGNACNSPSVSCNEPLQLPDSFADSNLARQTRQKPAEEACAEIFGIDATKTCADSRKRLQLALQQAKKTVDSTFNLTQNNENSYNNLWATYFSSDKTAKDTSYFALILLETTKLLRKFGMTLTQIKEVYNPQVLEEVSKKGLCQREPIEECAAGGFRTFSGYCNNVVHPMWGAVFQAFSRLVAPSYQDGISAPREAADGLELPTSSLVSQTIFTDSTGTKHSTASLLLAQWAQFVYDDLVKIGTSTGERQQANQATSFLDASMIYGNNGKTAALLRSYKDASPGELNVFNSLYDRLLLPQNKNRRECALTAREPCFLSGTNSVNLTPTQAALHTVWVLQHNRIAKRLKVTEKLFMLQQLTILMPYVGNK